MEREYLIQKWLDHSLNAEELEAFKKLEDYDALQLLNRNLQKFKAPEFDKKQSLDFITKNLKPKKHNNWNIKWIRIAAILVISIGSFWYFNKNNNTTINTLASQKTNIDLPDTSNVILNSASNLSYNEKTWYTNRKVNLDGEAFFKVAKGSSFDVKTEKGIVTVLGTQFNVKQRNNYFEVVCYQGLVGVTYMQQPQLQLKPGESFLVIDGKTIKKEVQNKLQPAWITNKSSFKSIPYKHVLSEFERQYNVRFITKGVDLKQLFTGNFTHDNFEIALKSITLPLHLTYSKKNNTITLKRE